MTQQLVGERIPHAIYNEVEYALNIFSSKRDKFLLVTNLGETSVIALSKNAGPNGEYLLLTAAGAAFVHNLPNSLGLTTPDAERIAEILKLGDNSLCVACMPMQVNELHQSVFEAHYNEEHIRTLRLDLNISTNDANITYYDSRDEEQKAIVAEILR